MTYPATNSKEASELLIDVSNQMHEIVNEDATTEVMTESGLVPSVRKALADTFLFQDPIAWNQGSDETAFNQLRTFSDNLYWAPTATTLNPIPMGATPIGDSNWKLAPVDVSREWTLQELTRSQNEVIGGKIFPLDDSVLKNGDNVPVGTTHLRVDTEGARAVVKMTPSRSGVVSSLSENSVLIGGQFSFLSPPGSVESHYVKTSDFGIGSTTTNPIELIELLEQYFDNIMIDTNITAEKRWELKSNKTYYQKPSTTIKKSDSYDPALALIRVNDPIENVHFWFPNLDGNRDVIPNTSEFGHLFDIRGGKDIYVYQGNANNGTGDGFYVGGGVSKLFSENVKLFDCSGRNNRRQVLSLTSAKGFRAPNFKGFVTDGIAPQAAIDIEPNDNQAELIDIVIDNPYTEGNTGQGIIVALNLIAGVNKKEIDIKINNHVDKGSYSGFTCEKLDLTGKEPVTGRIELNNPNYYDNAIASIFQRNYDSGGPDVIVNRPYISNPNQVDGTTPKYHSSITSFREPTDTGALSIGNLTIIEPSFNYDDPSSKPTNDFHFDDETGIDMVGIKIINPAKKIGTTKNIGFRASDFGFVSDNLNVLSAEFSVSFTINKASYSPVYSNDASSAITITMDGTLSYGYPDYKFVKQGSDVSAPWFRLAPPSGGTFVDSDGEVIDGQLEATIEGSEIIIRPSNNGKFLVVSKSGDWKRRVI